MAFLGGVMMCGDWKRAIYATAALLEARTTHNLTDVTVRCIFTLPCQYGVFGNQSVCHVGRMYDRPIGFPVTSEAQGKGSLSPPLPSCRHRRRGRPMANVSGGVRLRLLLYQG